MTEPISGLDWTIIAFYLVAVVGLGVSAGLLKRRGGRLSSISRRV
jgi:hypothetical protein